MSRQVILNPLSNPVYSQFKSIREMLVLGDGEQALAKPHQLRFGNGGDTPDRSKNGGRDFSIHADKGDGVGSALGLAPAEGERSDIDSELAKSRPNLADNTGFVAVPQIKNGAFELGLKRNAFDLQHPGRAVMEDC